MTISLILIILSFYVTWKNFFVGVFSLLNLLLCLASLYIIKGSFAALSLQYFWILIPYFFIFFISTKKFFIDAKLSKSYQTRLERNKALHIFLYSVSVIYLFVFNYYFSHIGLSTGGAVVELLGLMSSASLTYCLYLALFTKSKRLSVLVILSCLCCLALSSTRGALVFFVLSYLYGDQLLITLRSPLPKKFVFLFGSVGFLGIVISTASRFNHNNLAEIGLSLLYRSDAFLRFAEISAKNLLVNRDILDSIMASVFFLIPRGLYPGKPYPLSYELTKVNFGNEIASEATFNFSIFSLSMLNIEAIIFFVLMNFFVAIFIYYLLIKSKNSLVCFLFSISVSPRLLTAYEGGLWDTPLLKSIILTLIVCSVAALGARFVLKKDI